MTEHDREDREPSGVVSQFGSDEVEGDAEAHDRALGELLRVRRNLTEQQIDTILDFQRQNSLRFGEAAIKLKLVSNEDVLRALSQQYQYSYAPSSGQGNNSTELVVAANPFSDDAEVFRNLRTQLLLTSLSSTSQQRSLAVVSPEPGEGKSFVAANLAVAFSQLGGRTLLVDADMRTPRQHRLFGIGQTSGLSNILSGRARTSSIHQIENISGLFLLPSGAVPPNPLELIQHHNFEILLLELQSKFDFLIFDTPASVHGADSRVIANKCGVAMVVGRTGKTPMNSLAALVNNIEKSSAVLAGIVMNDF